MATGHMGRIQRRNDPAVRDSGRRREGHFAFVAGDSSVGPLLIHESDRGIS